MVRRLPPVLPPLSDAPTGDHLPAMCLLRYPSANVLDCNPRPALPLETPQSTQRSLVGGDCKEERWRFEVSPLALDGPLDAAGQGCPAGVHTGLMVISGHGTHGGKLKPRGCTNGVI